MRVRHVIRPAVATDGSAIAILLELSGWTIDGIDWSNIVPFWLVAEQAGEVVGCIQVALSRPIGYLEMLAVDQRLSGFARHAVVNDLLLTGLGVHMKNGATMVGGVIPFDMKGYKRVVKKRGGRVIASGNMLMMRSAGPATGVEREQ